MSSLSTDVPDLRCAHAGPVFVSVFLGWPTPRTLQAHAAAQRHVAAHFGRVAVLTIVPPIDSAELSPRTRVAVAQSEGERAESVLASAKAGEALERDTLASALVILPRGVMAVMIRSFVSALALASRSQAPLKTFKDLPPALAWLGAYSAAAASPALLGDVEALIRPR